MMTYVWTSTVSTRVLAFLTVCPIAAFLFNKNILYSTVSFCLLVCCVFLMHDFIRFQSETNKTKTKQLLKCITYGFFFNIKQSKDSGYLYIVFTYKRTNIEIAQSILLLLFWLCQRVMTCNSLVNFLAYTFLIFNFSDCLIIVWNDIIEG